LDGAGFDRERQQSVPDREVAPRGGASNALLGRLQAQYGNETLAAGARGDEGALYDFIREQLQIAPRGGAEVPHAPSLPQAAPAEEAAEVVEADREAPRAAAVVAPAAPIAEASPQAEGGGAAPELTAEVTTAAELQSESPAALLDSVADAPATQLIPTFNAAVAAAPAVHEAQRTAVVESMPELETSSGLEGAETETDAADLAVADVGQQAAIDVPEGAGGDAPIGPPLPDIPAAPPQPAVPIVAAASDSGESTQDPELAASGRAALGSVSLDTNDIPGSTGIPTQVPLTGDADPTRMSATRAQADGEVQTAAAAALEGVSLDFGETAIGPDATDGLVTADAEIAALASLPVAPVDPGVALPPAMNADLDAGVTPELGRRLGEATAEVQADDATVEERVRAAHTDAQGEIDETTTNASAEQVANRDQAIAAVRGEQDAWRDEISAAQLQARTEADAEHRAVVQQIETERAGAEAQALQHITHAEQQADAERLKAEQRAEAEKRKAEEESGGFWGWAQSAVRSLVDGLKSVVNRIYDGLRWAVKSLFEAAKMAVEAVIEASRFIIVGLIESLGATLIAIVSVFLMAVPELRDRFVAAIQSTIDNAVAAANAYYDAMKWALTAILDGLAWVLDEILAFAQGLANAAYTVIGMLVSGEFTELLAGLGRLVDAMGHVLPQLDIAAYEEVLGGNLDEPLPPEVLLAANITPPGMASNAGPDVAELPGPPWTADNVGVQAVMTDMLLSSGVMAEAMARTGGQGSIEFGHSDDPARSMDAILGMTSSGVGSGLDSELAGPAQIPDDGLDPRQRAAIKWDLMKDSLSTWFAENWPLVALGAVAGIGGIVGLTILTGGSIWAALGPLFMGLLGVMVAGHAQDYVEKAWGGDVRGGGKSLAKALAVLGMEALGWLTFKAGSLAVKGAQSVARGAAMVGRGAAQVGSAALRVARRGADFVMDQGRVLLKGLRNSSVGRAAQSLDDLGRRLLEQTKFRGFKLELAGGFRFRLYGKVNPWVMLADGRIVEVDDLADGAQIGKFDGSRLVVDTRPVAPGTAPEADIVADALRKGLGEPTDAMKSADFELEKLAKQRARLQELQEAAEVKRPSKEQARKIKELERQLAPKAAQDMDAGLKSMLDDAVEDARLVQLDEVIEPGMVPHLKNSQKLMNDLNRSTSSLGDQSTAYIVIAEQVKGGVGQAAKEVVEGTLHISKSQETLPAIFRMLRTPGSQLPASARARLFAELQKLEAAIHFAQDFKHGLKTLDDLPEFARPFADDLAALAP